MLKNIFRFTIFTAVPGNCFGSYYSVIGVNKLLYPTQIDSAFVNMQQLQFQKMKEAAKSDTSAIFLYSPSQLQINFTELEFPMPDSIKLRGWMAIDTTKMISPLLLIILLCLKVQSIIFSNAGEFSARGFNVKFINLRGQGNSLGEYYLPGQKSIDDLIHYPELRALRRNPCNILGSGSGCRHCTHFSTTTLCYCRCINLTKSVSNFEPFLIPYSIWWHIAVPFYCQPLSNPMKNKPK
ncbi:MAG: hypothetical protein IPL22_07810 [Bacteroidetes bacterium]|nr:hypothetical protein [Bacteroidota bacterium]